MGYDTKALPLALALFCLLALSTLFITTSANEVDVAKDVDEASSLRKVLNRKTIDSVSAGKEVTNEQDIQGLQDEKYYDDYGHYHYGRYPPHYHHGGYPPHYHHHRGYPYHHGCRRCCNRWECWCC